MKVQITEKHIKKGTPKKADSCPIALALMEQIPGCVKSRVETTEVMLIREATGVIIQKFHPSRKAQKFIKEFDAGKKVEPFFMLVEI